MWHIVSEEQQKKTAEAQGKLMKELAEEAAKKERDRQEWLRQHTCKACGRSDPVPPWLL